MYTRNSSWPVSKKAANSGATTRELLEMADWLKKGGCDMVAIESKASYWKPLYKVLETCELEVMVVNARHMKAVLAARRM